MSGSHGPDVPDGTPGPAARPDSATPQNMNRNCSCTNRGSFDCVSATVPNAAGDVGSRRRPLHAFEALNISTRNWKFSSRRADGLEEREVHDAAARCGKRPRAWPRWCRARSSAGSGTPAARSSLAQP